MEENKENTVQREDKLGGEKREQAKFKLKEGLETLGNEREERK